MTKNKSKKSKVTRVVYGKGVNKSKLAALREQARLLGLLRAEIWERFGSIAGVGADHRKIRNEWVKKTRDFSPLPAKAWKETLRNVLDDIAMYEAACKQKVVIEVYRRYKDEKERKEVLKILSGNDWVNHSFLSRRMRRYKKHGRTSVDNQIILEAGLYRQFTGKDGNTWLKVPSLVKGKQIATPLKSSVKLKGTLRLILRKGNLEVHVATDQKTFRKCGSRVVGVDQGYSEALADSDGDFFGKEFGKIMTEGTKVRHEKGIARNKLHALSKNHKNPRKKRNILKYNLGRKEIEKRNERQENRLRDVAFKAAHAVVDKASVVVSEDLSRRMKSSKDRGKKYNRIMNSWAKGYLSEALNTVTKARGSSLRVVNAAYTSQMDSKSGLLEGKRDGDKFYHASGDVSHADTNAANNILKRAGDTEIGLYMRHADVKRILQDRLLAKGGVSETSSSDRPSRTLVANRKRASTENEVTDFPSKKAR